MGAPVNPASRRPTSRTADPRRSPPEAPPAADPARPSYRAYPAPAPHVPNSASGPVVLRTENLHKWYGKKVAALSGVNVEVRKGEVVGFLGPNGAGKTTFTKCVLGLIRPTSGRIELFGEQVRGQPTKQLNRVGLVPDQYDLYPNLTGVEHLWFYSRIYGVPSKEREARIEEAIALVGMQEHAPRKTREYSHGMKQRLCIGQALLNNPDLVIFDEPTNGLDPRGAYEIRELIKALAKRGRTIFLSSHILAEVEQVCSRVIILSRGKTLVQSTVADLRRRMAGGKARVIVTLDNPSEELEELVVARSLGTSAALDGNKLIVELGEGQDVPRVIEQLVRGGARIRGVQEDVLGLEAMFLELTKGEGGL